MANASFNLTDLNGSNGFALNGIGGGGFGIGDLSGRSVRRVGDLNGDGIGDIIIGAPLAGRGASEHAGQSYVIFGNRSGFVPSLNLSSLNGSNGFAINGINRSDQSGTSVSGVGDINGDGIDDLIIGAPFAGPNGNRDAGQSYVIFGRRSGFGASFNLSSLNGSNGFAINGIGVGDSSGGSVSGAGDVNGDGIADIIIGARQASAHGAASAGQSYVIFGSRTGFSPSINLRSLNGSNGFAINGIKRLDYSGSSVSAAGDVNGDGIADLIIGASSRAAILSGANQSYVVFGRRSGFGASLDLSSLNGSNGFVINSIGLADGLGTSVSGAGDINGDGIADVIVGADRADPDGKINAGQSYVIYGSRSGFSPSFNLSSLNGTNGFAINGIAGRNLTDGDHSGSSVSGAGDVNGDGVADLLIGAYGADANGKRAPGQSYVIYGSRSGFSPVFNLSSLNGNNGFAINGIASGDDAGQSVSGAGDINGDGIADLIIGADQASPNGNKDAGQSYVIFGVRGNTQPLISSSTPGVGVTITDFIGNTLQTAYSIGDLNGSRFNYADSVNNSDINDVYRFHLDAAAAVDVGLTNLSANADLYLLDSAGNAIDFSIQFGNSNETINHFLNAGVYYVQVRAFTGASTSYSLSLNAGGTARDPGSDRSSARDLGNLSRTGWNINDFVGTSDLSDYYHFDLSENGNFHLSLSGLSSDVDVALYNRVGNLVTASTHAGTVSESIDRFLDAGTYYLRVYPWGDSSNYTLNVRTDTPSYSGIRTLAGTLGADTFDVTGNYTRTVVSGNGNVDFGAGRRDVLDLSGLLSTSVSINYANTTGAGVLYDPGNGTRVFDSILLNDGRQILFEGIDQIQFSDRTINLAIVPNDPLFSQQWNLSMMSVQDAWRFTTGSANVLIGIEDSGLGINNFGNIHPDLRLPIIVDNNLADEFDEPTSHGTSVEGILSAITNNGIGLSGINWNSPVAQVDVIPGSSVGDRNLTQATQELITQAARSGQRLVINLSLSANAIEPAFEQLVASHQTDVLFVISSGNDGISSLSYPAYLAYFYSNVIAVGASFGTVDSSGNAVTPGTRAPYSNYGYGLTLVGPTNVIATGAVALPSGTVFGYDPQFTGTSAAAPNVTGAASLVWSANPNLTAIQVQQVLSETAYDLGTPGYDFTYGHGFVNADTAVRRAIALAEGVA